VVVESLTPNQTGDDPPEPTLRRELPLSRAVGVIRRFPQVVDKERLAAHADHQIEALPAHPPRLRMSGTYGAHGMTEEIETV